MDANLHRSGTPRRRRGAAHAGALGAFAAVLAAGLVVAPSAVQGAGSPSAGAAAPTYRVELVLPSSTSSANGQCSVTSKDSLCVPPDELLSSFTLSLAAGGTAGALGKSVSPASSSTAPGDEATAVMGANPVALGLLPAVQRSGTDWTAEFLDPTSGDKAFQVRMSDVSVTTWTLMDSSTGASVQISWSFSSIEVQSFTVNGSQQPGSATSYSVAPSKQI